jgi:hypothetical protein
MQRLPKLPIAVILCATALAVLGLRQHAVAWQADNPAATKSSKAAAPATDPPPIANEEATSLIREARDRLTHWQSVQARIVERVDIADRRFKAEGLYMSGEFPRTRLEYKLEVGDTEGSLLEVCDGQVLHVLRTIQRKAEAKPGSKDDAAKGGEPQLKPLVEAVRRDVQKILRAAPAAPDVALPMHAANLGLGGLTALLSSLERTMVFESMTDETHDGRTFHILQGRWKPEALSSIMAKLGPVANQLSNFVPDKVRVDLDAESLFPVRILYLKQVDPARKAYRPWVSLEFHDVQFDVPLPADAFVYHLPPGVDEGDDTATYVDLMQNPPAAPDPSKGQPGEAPPKR